MVLLLVVLLGACTFDPPAFGPEDAQGPADGAIVEAGPLVDTGPRDAEGPIDAGEPTDAAPADAARPDADPGDVDPLDSGDDDGDLPDADPPDADPADADPLDAPADAGPPEAGPPDATPIDAGFPPVCGDGRVEAPETCDDANTVANDGCTMCQVDNGYECVLAPSLCVHEDDVQDVDLLDPNCLEADDIEDDEAILDPFCTIEDALSLNPEPELLYVATATYAETLNLGSGPDLILYAPNGAVLASNNGLSLTIRQGRHVTVSGFHIKGATGAVKIENNGTIGTLLDNRIGPTPGRGVDLRGDGYGVFARNVVIGNLDGGFYFDSNAGYDAYNNIIVDNGGANVDIGGVRLKKTAATARFVNNTIARNLSNRPAAVRCDVNATMENIVVWNNTGDLAAEISGRCQAQFSLLQAIAPGMGNITGNPLFVNGRLELSATSPAVDAGNPTGVRPAGPAPADDMLRVARPVGLAVDMGAYER